MPFLTISPKSTSRRIPQCCTLRHKTGSNTKFRCSICEPVRIIQTSTGWCTSPFLCNLKLQQKFLQLIPHGYLSLWLFLSSSFFYRPHLKDGGRLIFSVCQTTPRWGGGGKPIPGSFPGLWSQILSGEVPQDRGTPNQEWGTPCQDWSTPSQDWGTPWPWLGYPPTPARYTLWDRLCCGR